MQKTKHKESRISIIIEYNFYNNALTTNNFSEGITRSLENCILTHGVPEIIISDDDEWYLFRFDSIRRSLRAKSSKTANGIVQLLMFQSQSHRNVWLNRTVRNILEMRNSGFNVYENYFHYFFSIHKLGNILLKTR